MNARFRTFVINLDRSPERLELMQERLARAGLAWERIAGVEGSLLDVSTCVDVDEVGYRRVHGKYLNVAELGCYLSHIKALRTFLDGTWEHALILEDDADFPADIRPLLDCLLARRNDWDFVKLSGFHSGTPVTVSKLFGPYELAVPLSRLMNANSILFNRHAASVLLERLLPMKLPYDHALERAYGMGLRMRVVVPLPCSADSGLPSTIGDRRHLKYFKFPWRRRLPAMAFRVRTELQRVRLGLMHVLAERLLERLRRGAST